MLSSPISSARSRGSTPEGYTTRILKGAGLTTYARDVLAEWQEDLDFDDNLRRFQRSGVFGRASAGRASEILRVIDSRYLRYDHVRRGLGALIRARSPRSTIDLLLGYHAACSDRLLFDFGSRALYEWRVAGRDTVSTSDGLRFLERPDVLGPQLGGWSSATATEVIRKLLTAWRDFGLLRGAARKRIVRPDVDPLAIAWVVTDRFSKTAGTRVLVRDPVFRLFLLSEEEVEASLHAADGAGLLRVEGGGEIVRVTPLFANVQELADASR